MNLLHYMINGLQYFAISFNSSGLTAFEVKTDVKGRNRTYC